MELIRINTGSLRLDFNEMYRPKPPGSWLDFPSIDPKGSIMLAMRAVLFIYMDRKILIDPGPGYYIEEFFPGYKFQRLKNISEELQKMGLNPNDVTDIFLTHLHFDHCGGIFHKVGGKLEPAFPNAVIHCSKLQNEIAGKPDSFEKDAFLPIWDKLAQSLDIKLYEKEEKPEFLTEVFVSNGHTEGMLIPIFRIGLQEFAFLSDLIPTALNDEPDIVSVYDRDPALLGREKMLFLEKMVQKDAGFIYFHDDINAL
jgi:glyoxylase-like metal-dependent hydrolase (beta-lactamase superfamily II)